MRVAAPFRLPLVLGLAVHAALFLGACAAPGSGNIGAGKPLVHAVFVSLVDASPEAVAALAADCRRDLAEIPGIRVLLVGPREDDLVRDVNDTSFDLGLLVVFEDEAAHDAYLDDPRHLAFVAAHKANWKQVRVFDWDGSGG